MISYIRGIVDEVEEGSLIIEQGGMGFQVFVPGGLLDGQLRKGTEVKVYTYLHVKEDAMQLYGFLSRDDLHVFRLLLNVNGIGPKAALGILSGITADELRFAVLSDDTAAISKAPGIGKKTAQKVILELKDKFSLEDAFEQKLSNTGEYNSGEDVKDVARDAVQALVALGYSNTEAFQAVRKVEPRDDMDSEAMLKAALKYIM
ncbi:Holliday junction branch migration protein RuvA [Novisyntrophococcus fermenticellae]|uniref:Holliday junction branch migration protein RuvA n=1 Tax=Novisyntrophococcus fermenticellae TaxID=2068655 RepID=UPI001E436E61|nr:Holliday junction branch migration protein RuvA [Novisyntrophococcus fermenticellae]